MANLKAIRNRIRSVKATQKITSAMKMVAAAKVRRAQARVQAARPFTQGVVAMLQEAVSGLAAIETQELKILQRRDVKKVAIIVLSSDRGLCGSYNTLVFREVMHRVQTLQREGKEVSLILIGLKAAGFFKRIKIEKHKIYTLLPAIPTPQEAKLIATNAVELFVNGTVDAVEIIGTQFIRMGKTQVSDFQFVPVQLPPRTDHTMLKPERLFEPSIEEVMERELLPKYVQNVVYQALLEASASELAARMEAMTNASKNAGELIGSLTLVYNKARQANITQELLEIVGGAEALKN